jgi:diguanylate cyclase (GGDEF)-like protein/PAS domain S-box-containing protein
VLRKPFSDWPIRHKLRALFVAMAVVAAFAVSIPLGIFDVLGLKDAMARDLATLADVLARNSTAALTFHDDEAARDVLRALRAERSVTAACIYNDQGKPFAKYARDTTEAGFTPPAVQSPSSRFEADRLIEFRSIVLGNETVGTIYIESDLQKLSARYRQYSFAVAAAMGITLILASLLASWLQKPVSEPLRHLVQITETIASAGDYSIRAQLPNHDEFGLLVAAFNGLMEQIETRDQQLRRYREKLEDEVACRTAELSSANKRLKLQAAALSAAANSILITDIQGTIVWSNPAFSALTGYSESEIIGSSPRILNSGTHDKSFWADMWQNITQGKIWQGELLNRRKNGSLYAEEMTITPVSLLPGRVTHFVAIKQDITQRKSAESALRHAEEKYRAMFEDAVVGIFQITADGRPLSVNRALARMHGYDSPEEMLATISSVPAQLFVNPACMAELTRQVQQEGVVRGAEIQVLRTDHTKKWISVCMRALRDEASGSLLYEGTVEDITDRRFAEEKVQNLAYYDSLTGLPNRTLLQDRIEHALSAARRQGNDVAVLFLDLDRFKIINDSLGHSFGDLLLQEVAERLRDASRAEDTVARVGGDEFLIVLASLQESKYAATAAERIIASMSRQFSIQGHSFNVSCSIGISVFPKNGTDAETLIKNADAAMYVAKESGRNTFRFFTDVMNASVVERLNLEHSLRLALDTSELFVVYQPQVNISSGVITAAEALLRWRHPQRGLIAPATFIRVAENSGLILPVGEFVLNMACSEAQRWRQQFVPIPVAVNVSAVQFRQHDFLSVIKKVLQKTGLPPQYLELELTESLLLSNADMAFGVLHELHQMGVKLAIDDFGAGCSSLAYLRQFQVDKLKIDRSFIMDVTTDPDDAAITKAIIDLARSLNITVVAEGVENEAQMSFLERHHCDELQGFYISKPVSADEFCQILRQPMLIAASGLSSPVLEPFVSSPIS